MPPKRSKDEPKAQLTEQQQEQLSKAREKANATRMANATIRKAEKKTETEEKKREKEAKLKKAQEILGQQPSEPRDPQEAPEAPPEPEKPNSAPEQPEDLAGPGPAPELNNDIKVIPKKSVLPTKPQVVSKPIKKAKDIYYEEKLKLLRQKQSSNEPDKKPEFKPEPIPEENEMDTMTRNRLAYQMSQEQKKNYWKLHMGNEDFPETYF